MSFRAVGEKSPVQKQDTGQWNKIGKDQCQQWQARVGLLRHADKRLRRLSVQSVLAAGKE